MPSHSSLPLPPEYACIKVVKNFAELATTRFENPVNALCWPRALAGDFQEVVEKLGAGDGIITLDESLLTSLPVSPEGRIAINTLLEDLRSLKELELDRTAQRRAAQRRGYSARRYPRNAKRTPPVLWWKG